MAWQTFKFIVWFCKWRSVRELSAAKRHYENARRWTVRLHRIAEMIVEAQEAKSN